MDKTTEYLRLLQEKNRLKKMMATKSKDEQAKEELEKGFTTHFQGAHAVKDSKMPVPTKVTSVVKPLNIMGRFAKGANMMWGGEKKNGVLSPQKLACSDDQTEKDIPVSRNFAPDSSKHEDRNYQSEYESDFDDCSDVETDPKSNASIWKEKRGLPLPSLLEDDDTFFIDHGKTAIGDAKDAAGHVVAKDNNPLNMSVALDSTLQTRVKDLSAQQKLKLLKMLEHDLRDDVEANSPVDCDTSPPIANLDVTQADQRQGRKGPVNQQEEPVRQDAHSPHLLPQYPENIPLTFRIRIVSTWSSNAKFVSLGAIRLRLQGSDSSDLLPTLTTKVCSGLVPLATGSECMRALPQLLGNSGARRPSSAYRGSVSAVWKGPFSAESPLEFQFSGELPVSMMHGGGLENLELLLWNSESPPLNSSSARDVDVFVGNRCVWSGQLDEYDDGDATTGNMARRPGELAPTLAIFPWRSDSSAKPSNNTNIATKNNGKTESSAAINISKSELRETMTPTRDHRPGNDQPDWLVQQRPRNLPADDLLGDDYSLAHSPQRRTGEEPSLRRRRKEGGVDLETKVAESSTFGSPKKRVSTAGKRVSKALAKSVEAEEYAVETGTRQRESQSGAEVEDADNAAVTTNSNVSTTAAKRRATRRDRNHLIKELQLDRDDFVAGGQAMIEVSGGGFSPQRSVTAKQLREAELKKSIDSMAFNDKFNLGRLSASKLPLVRSTIETEENAGEHHLMEISGTLDDSLGRPTTPIISSSSVRDPTQLTADQAYGSPQRKLGRRDASSSALLGLAAGDTLTRAARDSDRTAKIDLVQEKITSTIADLAKIMSALPAGGISFGKPDLSKIDSPIQEAALLSEDFNVSTPPRTLASRPVIGTAVTEKASPKTAKEKDAAKVKPWHKKDAASSALKLSDPTTTVSSLRTLVIEIDSNWGDANYVGLNGVELYDRAGGVIQLNGAGGKGAGVRAITAFPRDLADLPQHKDDPRKVQNLLNGVNFTKNDLHSWLTPHVQLLKQADGDASSASATALPYIAKVVMELEPGVTPVMCRIFNYNRSRTRNQRGVKHFKLIMDDSILFEG